MLQSRIYAKIGRKKNHSLFTNGRVLILFFFFKSPNSYSWLTCVGFPNMGGHPVGCPSRGLFVGPDVTRPTDGYRLGKQDAAQVGHLSRFS